MCGGLVVLCTMGGQGRSQKKNKGVSKSHDHAWAPGVQNSGIMDTLYGLYLL